MAKQDTLTFGIIPHRPPSDEAVKAATERYVEWGRKNRIMPSPEWEAAHPQPTSQLPSKR